MSNNFIVNAQLRTDEGKGASRRLRGMKRIPAVIYGGHKEPVSLSLAVNEMVKHLESEAFYSHVLTVEVDGVAEKAVLKDLQRHPSKDMLYHFDFQRVSADEKLSMNVPLHFINEDACAGMKEGGALSRLMNEVAVACLPDNLPEFIEIDVADLNVGESIHLSAINLPEGVELPGLALGDDHDHPVVSVHAVKQAASEDDAEDAAEDAGSEE